ncbi:hypothetical protein [Haloferula sp.]|uniref:hypothetical protein n=1 Tax=Haloferula sp. TaxID=2497595 RepID=UPI003C70A3F4
MKKRIVTAVAALGLIGFSLSISSCADYDSGGGNHQMGAPGRTHTMPDDAHDR